MLQYWADYLSYNRLLGNCLIMNHILDWYDVFLFLTISPLFLTIFNYFTDPNSPPQIFPTAAAGQI